MNDNMKAGGDINAGDCGYNLSTQERYEEFKRSRMMEELIKNAPWTVWVSALFLLILFGLICFMEPILGLTSVVTIGAMLSLIKVLDYLFNGE
jgi:uncharacterized membrane protein HdeD (DUF308 family)